jgi:hypothetical protein
VVAGDGPERKRLEEQAREAVGPGRVVFMGAVSDAELPALYAHCLGASANPRLTVTSYPLAEDETVWYLGGDLAEHGVGLAPRELVAAATRELGELLPWVDLRGLSWGTLAVDRAESAQPGGRRPDSCYLHQDAGLMVAWPTKLAFAPLLASQALEQLAKQGVLPGGETPLALDLKRPPLARPPWEREAAWI